MPLFHVCSYLLGLINLVADHGPGVWFPSSLPCLVGWEAGMSAAFVNDRKR